jgi:hypothetical protein
MFIDGDVRIQVAKPLGAAGEFCLADLAVAEKYLAVQVRRIHGIELDDPDTADTGGNQVHGQR